jgi:hypothetical protein
VQFLHERAFLMGDDDPHRPDYSRFVETKQAKKRSSVDPLMHGHLNNRLYVEEEEELHAVVKIQSLFRSRRDRRIAEIAAKQQAFGEAKECAINEMKKKIMEEFRNRETGFGVGKLKWDAQVRMRQAKIRTSGQSVNRSETVMIMMEEAISRALEEIEAKFVVIAEKEGYAHGVPKALARPVTEAKDALGMFGLVSRPAVSDSDDVVDKIETPRPDDDEVKDGAAEDEAIGVEITKRKSNKSSGLIQLNPETYKRIVQGFFEVDLSGKGETIVERELRLAMASPSPSLAQLGSRIRALDPAFSGLRTVELLSSVPSKQLLLQFIEVNSEKEIEHQLSSYYSISKNAAVIARIFKKLVKSDMERGIYTNRLEDMKSRVDVAVRNQIESELRLKLPDLEKRINSRLQSSIGAAESEIIREESEKLQEHIVKFTEDTLDTLAAVERLHAKYRKTMLSILELERRKSCMSMLLSLKAGRAVEVDVPIEVRGYGALL